MATSHPSNNLDIVDERLHDPGRIEKAVNTVAIDNIQVLGLRAEDAEFYTSYPPEARKKLLWKIDIRLIPILAVLYLISHLDRANIGNAKIEGLTTDLGLNGVQWNIVLSIFFIPYVLLEVPSNMFLKNLARPSVYLGILMTCWGIIMTLTGITQNFAGIIVARIFLGIFEAGFFPGAVYLCTFWYMPKELSTRLAIFYCASALSGAFSGLLAAGIAQMDGVGGQAGWRWIFILEGIVTVLLGVVCFFVLLDSPRLSTKWLSTEEIRYLELQHFIKEGGHSNDEKKRTSWKDIKATLLNWRMYMLAYILLVQGACSYGTKFNGPTITEAMGFTSTNAQLMTVPMYVAGAISAVLFSILSDRFYWRMPFVAIPLCFIVIGYAIMISLDGALSSNVGLAYFAICLTTIGIYPIHPATSSWTANNVAPSGRRAVSLAFNICIGNSGGVIGSYMYLDSENPYYYTGFGLSLALGGSALIVALLLELSFWVGNKRRQALDEGEVRTRYSNDELVDMGDKSPLFRYTL
ncbi:major facilitator superfamily domain-containing protein [Aspergillus unguis]